MFWRVGREWTGEALETARVYHIITVHLFPNEAVGQGKRWSLEMTESFASD